ncbi:MAG: hypothetical protein IH945_01445 [Armatimonadetes bacterium]|nr:hypothetical protein [Armatimonadota bacterium]
MGKKHRVWWLVGTLVALLGGVALLAAYSGTDAKIERGVPQGQEEAWIGTVYPDTHPVVVRDRVEFTKMFGRIEEGTTMAQVRAILGPPDDVVEEDERDLYIQDPEVKWKYGSVSKLSFSAYGEVRFVDGRAIRRWRNRIKGGGWHDEQELIKALHALAEYGDISEYRTHPQDLERTIRAANQLISMGEDGARVAILEYERLVAHDITRSLRPVQSSALAAWLVLPGLDDQKQDWEIVGGVPLRVEPLELGDVEGWDLSEVLEERLKKGVFRTERYRPDDDPGELIQHARKKLSDTGRASWVSSQVASLFFDLVEPTPKLAPPIIWSTDSISLRRYLDDINLLEVRWDEDSSRYVPVNGSSERPKRPLYRRFNWAPGPLEDIGLEIQVLRESSKWFMVGVRRELAESDLLEPMPEMALYVEDVESGRWVAYFATNGREWRPPIERESGEEFDYTYFEPIQGNLWMPEWSCIQGLSYSAGGYAGSRDGGRVSFTKAGFDLGGQAVRLTLDIDGKTYKSPLLKP